MIDEASKFLLHERARLEIFKASSLDAVQFYFLPSLFLYGNDQEPTGTTGAEAVDLAIQLFRELLTSGHFRAVRYSYDDSSKQFGPPLLPRTEPIDKLEAEIRKTYNDTQADLSEFGFLMSLDRNA